MTCTPGTPAFCTSSTSVQSCLPTGVIFESTCQTGRGCIAPTDGGSASCQCLRTGTLGCSSGDVYEYDSCGTRLGLVEDCLLSNNESCLVLPDGVGCSRPVSCTTDSNCASRDWCSNGTCVPDLCNPAPPGDRAFCNGETVTRCPANGSGFTVVSACDPTDGGRVCLTLPTAPYADCRCRPNARQGCSNTDIYNFDSCGVRGSLVSFCTPPADCVEGPNGPVCARNSTCQADQDCIAGEFCSGTGVCTPRVCTPGAQRCDGNQAQRCDVRGTAWEVRADCVNGQVCTTAGSVASCTCTPNARTGCSGNQVYNFNSCGVRGTLVTTCSAMQVCEEGPAGASCVAAPPLASCLADAICGTGNICLDGACVRRLCTPNAQFCAEGTVRQCDSRGAGSAFVQDCPTGATCTPSGTSATCLCAANARRGCLNGDIYQFDSCGQPGQLFTDCGAGTCVALGTSVVCAQPPPSPPPDAGACVPNTSACSGRICGTVVLDNCGQQVTCQASTSTCCTPNNTAACMGQSCGATVTNNCGQQVTCGSGSGCCTPNLVACQSQLCGTQTTNNCGQPVTCMPGSGCCTPAARNDCYLGDLWSFDSCNRPERLVEDCPGAVTCNAIGGPAACRSSVADAGSPFWSRACPLVQDVENPTLLPADCRCFVNRAPVSGIAQCVGLQYVPVSTRFGTGPSIRSLPQSLFNGGVVIGRELFVGVSWSSSTRPNQGLVMAVNLDTGARRIVSGGYEDAANGFQTTGSGPAFANVIDVQGGASGLYALSVGAQSVALEIHRVDPVTGARTVVWRSRDAAFGQCPSGDPARTTVTYHDRVFGLDAQGNFVLAFRGAGPYSEGVGLVRISANGSSCSVITRSGAGALNQFANADVGGGVTVDRGFYSGFALVQGQFYVLNDALLSLFRVDPMTGNRTRISSASSSTVLGAGPINFGGIGQRWLTWDAARNVMWATGVQSYRTFTAIDLVTGDRTEATCRTTNPSVPWRNVCLGGVLEGGFQNLGGFWLDPANGDPIVVHENHSLVRADLRNGNSMRFSQ
jgi:hypothetical protein